MTVKGLVYPLQSIGAGGATMITGVIKTRDILLHPVSVISISGLVGFFRILRKAISHQSYHFIDFIEITRTKIKLQKLPSQN